MVECKLGGMEEGREAVAEGGRAGGMVVDMGVDRVVGKGVDRVVDKVVDRVAVGSGVVVRALSGQCGKVVGMVLVVGEVVVEELDEYDG